MITFPFTEYSFTLKNLPVNSHFHSCVNESLEGNEGNQHLCEEVLSAQTPGCSVECFCLGSAFVCGLGHKGHHSTMYVYCLSFRFTFLLFT